MIDLYQPPEDEDDARMRRAVHGDTTAFGELVRRHQTRVAAFATRMLGGDRDVAEDVTQETFLRLWRTRSAYRAEGRLPHYLLRIAANLCLDRQRNRAAHPTAPLDDAAEFASSLPALHRLLEAETLANAVQNALSALPEAQRAVFILSHYDGLSYREIAALLDCPIGTVASRKNLAVEALRRRLRPHVED